MNPPDAASRPLTPSESSSVPERARLSVGVIGGLRISRGGTALLLPNRKARGILAHLALDQSGPISRERLAGLFWPDVSEHQARNSLRQAIFELRAALKFAGLDGVLSGRDPVTLDSGHIDLDVNDLLSRVAIGHVPEMLFSLGGRDEDILTAYEDLSPLFGEWLTGARRDTKDRLLRGLARGFADSTVSPTNRRLLAEAALRLDSMHEEACRTIMRLAAENGETGVALRAYAALYEVLGAELDMEPSAATLQLVVEIKTGVFPRQKPPVRAPAAETMAPRLRRGPLAPDDAPVIAILPFRPLGPEVPPEYLLEGIVEDIVNLLAGLREPVVISANSTRRFRSGDQDDLSAFSDQLGADYLVTGSVRLNGNTARIAVELAETSQGAVLWGHTTEVATSALFEAQADIAAGIANALVPRMNEAELRASRRRAPDDLGAYHLMLRARDLMFRLTPEPFEEAGRLLDRAASLDPDYAPIHASMIEWRSYRIFQGWSPDREADTRQLDLAANTALRLDPNHSRALALYGHSRTIIGQQYDEALDLLDRAVASGPNDAETLIWSSPTLAYVGRAEEAIARASRAIALSPRDPVLFPYEHFLSIAHYAAGELEPAARMGLRSAARHPNFTSNLRFTVAALAGLGREAEAAPLVERLMSLQPKLRVSASLPRYAFRDQTQRERHARYLRLAGVPG